MNLRQKITFFIFVIHRDTVKYMITLCIPKLLLKKFFYFFSLLYIRMSGKNIYVYLFTFYFHEFYTLL